MFNPDIPAEGTSFICNTQGHILRVLHDDTGLVASTGSFFLMIDLNSKQKAHDFWKAVQDEMSIFNRELNAITQTGPKAYKFSGFKTGEGILISAAKQDQTLESLVEELMAMLNEAQNLLRVSEKASSNLKKENNELNVFSEMTKLNNEVINIQRKLAKQNAEISRLNKELEQRVKERTTELTSANQTLEAFSYSLSHELRTPVKSIMGFTKLIKDHYSDRLDEDLKECFSHIESSGKQLNGVVSGFSILMNAVNVKLDPEEVDLTALFQQVWDKLLIATPHLATLSIPPMPVVCADKIKLEEVLTNLLANSIKYTAKTEKPVIGVSYEKNETDFVFAIKDNGVGFDMKYSHRLFGAFQRLHSDYAGIGVGLAVVKRIIETHGGKVWAEAKTGEGATFYFTIPIDRGVVRSPIKN